MKAIERVAMIMAVVLSIGGSVRQADEAADVKAMYDKAKPSLVAVKYTWASELGSRELSAAGIIISDDGLVMIPMGIVTPALVPDSQMKDFKIIVPSENSDETEIDATLEGRDERSSLAFIRAVSPQKWKAVKFVDLAPQTGDLLYSVGILPKTSGYRTNVTRVIMSTPLRGPVAQILVDGTLAGVGAVVLDARGDAIGYVHARSLSDSLLDNPENPDDLPMLSNPPRLFIPSRDYLKSLADPPTADKPIVMPWLGCEMKGLEKEDAEYFGLTNVPAVQIGDVVANSPAEKAGLKKLDIITKINGEPIQRGDMPDELPQIVTRTMQWMKVGQTMTLTILRPQADNAKKMAPQDISVTLEARPKQPWAAHRFYARDLGFVARDVTFADAYRRKLAASTPGVVVALLRPQAAAYAAKLAMNDLITQMNGKAVTDLDEFKKDYTQFRDSRPNDPVVLEVLRLDGKQQTINIEPPQDNAQPGQ